MQESWPIFPSIFFCAEGSRGILGQPSPNNPQVWCSGQRPHLCVEGFLALQKLCHKPTDHVLQNHAAKISFGKNFLVVLNGGCRWCITGVERASESRPWDKADKKNGPYFTKEDGSIWCQGHSAQRYGWCRNILVLAWGSLTHTVSSVSSLLLLLCIVHYYPYSCQFQGISWANQVCLFCCCVVLLSLLFWWLSGLFIVPAFASSRPSRQKVFTLQAYIFLYYYYFIVLVQQKDRLQAFTVHSHSHFHQLLIWFMLFISSLLLL